MLKYETKCTCCSSKGACSSNKVYTIISIMGAHFGRAFPWQTGEIDSRQAGEIDSRQVGEIDSRPKQS